MNYELKRWQSEYAKDVEQYANDRSIADNMRNSFPYPYTRQDAQRYVEGCAANDETAQLCRAIVVDGRAVGSIGVFVGSDIYCKSAELGYWLGKEFRGNGIVTGAIKQLCAEAFLRFDIVRICAEPFAYNTGSCRVLEKAGFTLEGIKRRSICKNGVIHDSCVYALLKNE